MDGTPRLSRDGEPVYHYSFLSTFADACVVPERSCVPIADDVPFDVAALVGCAVSTGVGAVVAHGGRAGGRSRRDRRLRRRRTLGSDGRGRRRSGARHRRRRCAAEARRRAVVRRDGRGRLAGERRGDRGGRARRVERRSRLRDRGDRTTGGDGGGVPLHAAARRGRAHRHPARGRRAVPAGDHDPADGTAHPRLDLRLDEARAGLPAHARPLSRRAAFRSTASSRTGCRSRRPSAGSSSCTPETRYGWCSSCEPGRAGRTDRRRLERRSAERLARQRRAGTPRQPHARRRDLDVRAPGARPHTRSRLRRRDARPTTSPSGRRR